MKVQTGRIARLRQGDVIRDVACIEYAVEKKGVLEVSKIVFPYAVVLSQDCDLAQDHDDRSPASNRTTQDKHLISVLVAPVYNLEHVRSGSHLSELNLTMAKVGGTELKGNKWIRYHFLEFPPSVQMQPSVVDFKHYFTVNVKNLREQKRRGFVCTLGPLYRENLCVRFANYLARIGLPSVKRP